MKRSEQDEFAKLHLHDSKWLRTKSTGRLDHICKWLVLSLWKYLQCFFKSKSHIALKSDGCRVGGLEFRVELNWQFAAIAMKPSKSSKISYEIQSFLWLISLYRISSFWMLTLIPQCWFEAESIFALSASTDLENSEWFRDTFILFLFFYFSCQNRRRQPSSLSQLRDERLLVKSPSENLHRYFLSPWIYAAKNILTTDNLQDSWFVTTQRIQVLCCDVFE